MISRRTIDEIFSVARIEEVIGEFVTLKKSGSNLVGLSPFTNEKTPSFTVSPSKNIWKDFSSGKGGNVVTFLMEHEHFTYPEALRYLAKKYNIEIEEDGGENQEQIASEKKLKEALFHVLERANAFFQEQLFQTDEGQSVGLKYLYERGFTEATIRKFQIGYSPSQKDAFTSYALSQQYKKEILEKSGLSVFGELGGGVDRFRERIIFPIHSFSGRVIGFGGRILSSDKKVAKYINSPETEVYKKSDILYGIYFSKQSIIQKNECFLVEGYTDVISLHQAGIENVVASGGTSLTENQIRLIKRLTPNVTLLYDGDPAGIKAAFRGTDMLLQQGMNVRLVLFPDGEDPDSFATKNDTQAVLEFIQQNKEDFIRFKAKILAKEVENDPIGKAAVVNDIISSIALVQNLVQQESYIKECSALLRVQEEVLFRELQKTIQKKLLETSRKPVASTEEEPVFTVSTNDLEKIDPVVVMEQAILECLIKYGEQPLIIQKENGETEQVSVADYIIEQILEDEIQFKIEQHREIFEEYQNAYKNQQSIFHWTENDQLSPNLQSWLSESLIEKHIISENWQKMGIFVRDKLKTIGTYADDIILRYKWHYLNELIGEIQMELQKDEDNQSHLEKILRLKKLNQEIARKLNRSV